MTPAASRTQVGEEELAGEDGLLVYGIVEASGAPVPEGLTGVDEAPVQVVPHGRVAAVVGTMALERPPGRRRELLAYSSALDAIAGNGAVIPVQFGSVLPDRQSVVEELLAPAEEHFSELLGQLVGRAQFSLRASYREDVVLSEVVAADPEIAELRRRTRDLPEDAAFGDRVRLGELVSRAMERKRINDADDLLEVVLKHTVAHVVRPGGSLEHVLDVALLVEDEHRTQFEDALEELAEAVHERMRLRMMGPSAAYDFVEGV